jgi:RsiW-degrading membrane proteinase PrsW (M82 family)
VILYVTFAACAAGAALLVYRYDLYDREPWPLVALSVGLGAGGMACAGWLEAVTFRRFDVGSLAALAFLAAGYEETLKLLAVIALALFFRSFNDPMDGLIYGSMAGLGAALEEGIAVLRAAPAGGWLLPPEELVRLCGHLVMGGIGGFGVGCLVYRDGRWPRAMAASFLSAVLLHFGWDLAALRAEAGGGPAGGDALLSASLMLAGFILYGRLVRLGSLWSQQVFAPGAPVRLGRWV